MHSTLAPYNALLFYIFLLFSPLSFSQETSDKELLEKTIIEISDYTELIKQINSEKNNTIGYVDHALSKQLFVTEEAYRNLLWQFIDDLVKPKNKDVRDEHTQFASAHLLEESTVLKKAIEQSYVASTKLENQIILAKKKVFTVNQAVTKDRLSKLKWKLHLVRINQESLYSALVKNAERMAFFNSDPSEDIALSKKLVKKQADMLSGLIGINEDKLLKLEKKLSVIRNESDTGKKLISEIALKNVEIQDYATRLQAMVDLLTDMKIDSSLYKKTVIQSTNSLSSDIFDKRVASHLFTEWWLNIKKWFTKQAPTILSKSITFFGIILLAYLVAALAKKMVRGVFHRTRPDMSELAKKFIVSMTSKLVMLIGILIGLSNMGFQIGPILAGLGIMGFIIGFALQETLSNFASGLMILIYRPFDVGDKIRISGLEGKVRKMNLVSTTIFTSANHHLTIPNNKIWKDTIHNITSQPQVRLDIFFMAPFNAASETVLAAISDEIEENPIVIRDMEKNIRIYELGESEVKYVARFWISSDDIDEARWVISEGVKKRFDVMGISENIIENVRARAI